MQLFYEPQGAYFGDCMPFYHDGKFYVFHQRDKRDPQPFEPFEWSLATTTDFIHYEDMGVAIPKEGEDDPEQYIFAGSVFEGEGKFHAIYTAYNRNYAEQGKDAQHSSKGAGRFPESSPHDLRNRHRHGLADPGSKVRQRDHRDRRCKHVPHGAHSPVPEGFLGQARRTSSADVVCGQRKRHHEKSHPPSGEHVILAVLDLQLAYDKAYQHHADKIGNYNN